MNIKKTVVNVFSSILRGDILERMGADRVFVYILYFFMIILLYLYANLKIEQTLTRVEQNSETLESLKIYHAQKTGELAAFDRISTVEGMLQEKGSSLGLPEKPATHIK